MFADALAQILKRLHQLRVFDAQVHSKRNRLVINPFSYLFKSDPEPRELKIRFTISNRLVLLRVCDLDSHDGLDFSAMS